MGDAIKRVNQICGEMGILLQRQQFGVFWKQENEKCHAELAHNKKKFDGGHFDSKITAAMSVNLLCDKFGIKRKNATYNIQLEKLTIQAINNAINEIKNEIILFDLQQVTQMFKTQNTDGQKNSIHLWSLFDSPVKTVILAFLIIDYDSTKHIIQATPHIIENESHIIEDESHKIEDGPKKEKRKRKKSDASHLQDKIE